MRRFHGLFAASCLALAACTSTTATTGPIPPTAIVVDPAQFLGEVVCSDAPGAMQSYVATLIDVSPYQSPGRSAGTADQPVLPDGAPFPLKDLALPSSPPTPCTQQVFFERLIVDRDYVAVIDGYDRAGCSTEDRTNCITGQGSTEDSHRIINSGSPIMVDNETKAYVAPRWHTSCGRETAPAPRELDAGPDAHAPPPEFLDAQTVAPEAGQHYLDQTNCVANLPRDGGVIGPFLGGPVCATLDTPITITGCTPLKTTSSAPTETGISVDLTDALAGLSCGTGVGQVQSFAVTLDGDVGAARSAPCAGSVEYDGLTPGAGYTFHVVAFGAGQGASTDAGLDASVDASSLDAGSRTWTTTCYREAVGGVVVRAGCDPLQSAGPS